MASHQRHVFSLDNLPEPLFGTPLFHLTSTNDPPADHEIDMVNAIINADKVTINKIDKMLNHLSDLRQVVQARRIQYTQRIDLHKNILKPHRSLPSDILCEIFQHAIVMMAASFGSSTSPHRTLPRVCRRWRKILFSNPKLWTIFPTFDLSKFWTKREDFSCSLRSALRCSRAAPLDIEIRHALLSNFEPNPTLATLLPCSDRYRQLSLSICYQHLPQLASIKDNLGGLRSLDLHIFGGLDPPDFTYPLNLFDNAPNLQILTISGPFFRKPLFKWLRVPWPQLVQFSGHAIKPIDIVTLLTHATSLEDCTFYCVFPAILVKLPNVIHHKLVKLRIWPQEGAEGDPLTVDVLNQLTLPSLLEITIKDIALQITILVELITRSNCVLRFVDLETTVYDDISPFINVISAVCTLCIIPTETLMKALLVPGETENPVLPQLHHLMFYCVTAITAQGILWIPMSRATQPAVEPLETFIVKVRLPRSQYKTLYDIVDGWPGLNIWDTHFPVYQEWIKLIECSTFQEDYQDELQQQMALAEYLTVIEGIGGVLHPRYLYETSILQSTMPLCQIAIENDQYNLQARLSNLVAGWVSALNQYLNGFGWMHPPLTDFERPTEIVYGKRENSLLLSASVKQSWLFSKSKKTRINVPM